ncbi:MAG TPA: DUF3592 domain-containing protein [Burkholderiaceae bacterium]|nr:DUF3592 domain-containing protein [Burkholderiaceae bacterium]
MAANPVLGAVFCGVGLFAQGVALVLVRRSVRLLRAEGRAQGRVVRSAEEMVPSSSGGSRRYYFPVVEFKTSQGESITFQSGTGRGAATPPGTEVTVLFDPERPSDAEISTFMTLWFFPLVTSLFGLPFLAAGLLALS